MQIGAVDDTEHDLGSFVTAHRATFGRIDAAEADMDAGDYHGVAVDHAGRPVDGQRITRSDSRDEGKDADANEQETFALLRAFLARPHR